MILGADENLQKLLDDLGVLKLFNLVTEDENTSGGKSVEVASNSDMLTTAQTVAEAHRALVGADSSNAEKFKQVIEFADQDVERLSKEK